MLGDLSQDIIGTNPKYAPIVNHDWLTVNPQTYDNFPSDNNPVRIQPKLSELWNHQGNSGLNLIPNAPSQCLRSAETNNTEEVVAGIVREAKKAMMVGCIGKELADHLRSRFAAESIIAAKDALSKLAEEQGLLGNVYVDASAFTSAKEAEQFLLNHRNRLAQDIVVNQSKLNSSVIDVLASRYHKNVVASINYDENLYKKYRDHLVASGRIGSDFVVNSKETLRQAFMAQPVVAEDTIEETTVKKFSDEAAAQDINNRLEKNAAVRKNAEDQLAFNKARPIVEYARQSLSRGKTGSTLKQMLLDKYAEVDVRAATKYLAIALSEPRMASIDQFVSENKISEETRNGLVAIAKKYPVKQQENPDVVEKEKAVGVQGYFYPMANKKTISNELKTAAVDSLRSGLSFEAVKETLLKATSNDEADLILAEAVQEFNSAPAGIKANKAVKAPKAKLVEDLPERQTLPDAATIKASTDEILGFYDGMSSDIAVNNSPNQKDMEIGGLFNRAGIDEVL